MIGRLRQALASPSLGLRLAEAAVDLPASAPVSLTFDLGSGHDDWLSRLPGQGRHFWYWARPRHDDYRLGLGQALHVASTGAKRFTCFDRTFAGLSRQWRHESPPLAFLGFAFDAGTQGELPNALLAVPAVLLHSRQGQCTATLTSLAGNVKEAVGTWSATLDGSRTPAPAASPRRLLQPLADRAWRARVQAALADIEAGRLDKLVLSRRARLSASQPISPAPLLAALLERQPGSIVYAHGNRQAVFLGATPELLVALHRGAAEADALAGTAWPGSARLHAEKNTREQSLVVEAVRAALAPLCQELSVSDSPETVQVGPLSHLRSRIGGPVRPGVGLFDLVRALHPTPAVGGTPTAAALEWLRRHGEARGGWYGGGIGWIEAGGDGEVAVALRCALLSGNQAELHAGAGIVAGSCPEQELAETEAKLATLLDVLRESVPPAMTGT